MADLVQGPWDPPDGFEWAWEVDPAWKVPAPEGRLCRMSQRGKVCARPAVAMFPRPHRRGDVVGTVDWPYCELHLYGRRIVGGHVELLRLRKREGVVSSQRPSD